MGQRVDTSFACREGAGGPGIATCTDSTGTAGSIGTLDTSTPGPHTYAVVAVSKDGERGEASISYTVVPKTPPAGGPGAPGPPRALRVRILYSPNQPHHPDPAGGPRYTFHFTDREPGVTFTCSLDGGPFRRCRSPKVPRGLAAGRHVFAFRSEDPAGRVSPVRKVSFKVAGGATGR